MKRSVAGDHLVISAFCCSQPLATLRLSSPLAMSLIPQDLSDDEESHSCRRCHLSISEGYAYELGGDRWHMYCFSCSKCSKLLGTSSNFMVLGTGDLICSDCSYNCNSCGKKIDDLAILTGDQAYCSKCFCCRNCHKKIEDLRYARTSKGLFCMSCHEKLLEKKKRHDINKNLSVQQNRYSSIPIDKSLPSLPSGPTNIKSNTLESHKRVHSPDSFLSGISSPGIVNDKEAETIITIQSSPKHFQSLQSSSTDPPPRSPNRQAVLPVKLPQSQNALAPAAEVSPPKLKSKSPPDSNTDNSDIDRAYSYLTSPKPQQETLPVVTPTRRRQVMSPSKTDTDKTPNADIHRKAVVMDSVSSSSSNNFLSSYMNSNDSPPPMVQPPQLPFSIPRENSVADLSSVADDFIDMNDTSDNDEDDNEHEGDDENEDQVSSVYSVEEDEKEAAKFQFKPTGFSSTSKALKPNDLNIAGDFNEDKEATTTESINRDTTPLVSSFQSPHRAQNTGQSPIMTTKQISPETSLLSRSRSMKSPKNFLNNFTSFSSKHKKSESADYKISSPFLTSDNIQYNNFSNVATPKVTAGHSPSLSGTGAALFQTPPVDTTINHRHQFSNSSGAAAAAAAYHKRSISSDSPNIRSTHDMNTYDGLPHVTGGMGHSATDEKRYLELELRSLKVEIMEMKQTKTILMKEIHDLFAKKDVLNQEVLTLSSTINELKIDDQPTQAVQSRPSAHSRPSAESHIQPAAKATMDKSIISNSRSNVDSSASPGTNPQSQQHHHLQPPTNSETSVLSNGGDKKSRKFWKRGLFKSDANNISNSQSSYSISNILNSDTHSHDDNSNGINKHLISEPFLKNTEVDELGGNDNRKLPSSNTLGNPVSSTANKFIDLNTANLKATSGSADSSQGNLNQSSFSQAQSNLIMSDLFNSTLESRAIFEKREIPLIITRLVEEVEKRGLDSEGIYRKNGGTSQMNSILNSFNNLHQAETSNELEKSLEGDINAITSSLKRYLYFILPEPIFPNNLYDEFMKIDKLPNANDKHRQSVSILKSLPNTNLKTLEFLLKHFQKVEKFNHLNKMNFYNLSVVFGPTFTRVSSGERELADMKSRNAVMEYLLRNTTEIFDSI